MKRFLVAMDGSAQAQGALLFAIDLARGVGAEIIACHAIGKLTRLVNGEILSLDEYRALLVREFEDEWCQLLNDSGLRYQKIAVDGNPITTLLEIAKEEQADMIIVGSRSHTLNSLLSSTCHQLIEHSTIPVVVVPSEIRHP